MEPVSVDTLDEAANAVHRALGPGLSEVVYQTALAVDLRRRGYAVETEVVIPIFYQQTYVGFVRADLVVNQCTVVEVKAVAKVTEAHMLQLENYMRWLSLDRMMDPPADGTQGAVINFGGKAVATIGTVMGEYTTAPASTHADNQA